MSGPSLSTKLRVALTGQAVFACRLPVIPATSNQGDAANNSTAMLWVSILYGKSSTCRQPMWLLYNLRLRDSGRYNSRHAAAAVLVFLPATAGALIVAANLWH
jgi:hypothetical protein